VAEEFGDDDEVGAATDERRRERVPKDMDRRALVEARGSGDADDDVVGTADAQAPAALVEKQRRAGLGAGPVSALIEPASERSPQLGVDGDVADAVTV